MNYMTNPAHPLSPMNPANQPYRATSGILSSSEADGSYQQGVEWSKLTPEQQMLGGGFMLVTTIGALLMFFMLTK